MKFRHLFLLSLAFCLHTTLSGQLSYASNENNNAFRNGVEKNTKSSFKKKSDSDLDFWHGLGGTLFYAPSTGDNIDNSTGALAATYFPSMSLSQFSETASLRLGFSPSFGLSGVVNSRVGGSLSFAFELPVDAELHFGNHDLDGFGGHLGAGFAFNRINDDTYGANTAYGPHFTGGLKAYIAGNSYSLRAAYLLNLKSGKDEYGYDWRPVFAVSLLTYWNGFD